MSMNNAGSSHGLTVTQKKSSTQSRAAAERQRRLLCVSAALREALLRCSIHALHSRDEDKQNPRRNFCGGGSVSRHAPDRIRTCDL